MFLTLFLVFFRKVLSFQKENGILSNLLTATRKMQVQISGNSISCFGIPLKEKTLITVQFAVWEVSLTVHNIRSRFVCPYFPNRPEKKRFCLSCEAWSPAPIKERKVAPPTSPSLSAWTIILTMPLLRSLSHVPDQMGSLSARKLDNVMNCWTDRPNYCLFYFFIVKTESLFTQMWPGFCRPSYRRRK